MLNAAPIALPDPFYSTAKDTALTVDSQGTTLLDNDWDPEGSSLTASVVDNPANGTLSNFNSAGTFTYTPDTGFEGFDSFTYDVSDGTDDSEVVTVSIAVGGHFGPRTNQDELLRGSGLLTGELTFMQELTPGLNLVYNSSTAAPDPIVVLETSLLSGSSVPDEITAQLTYDGTAGTTYEYNTTGLSAGDSLRFALQADGSSISTGHYDYSIKLSAEFTSSTVDHTYSGSSDVVSRSGSSEPFGRGWHLEGLWELDEQSGDGVLLATSDGQAYWFAENGSGYDSPPGDFSTLVQNVDDTFTLISKHGDEIHFDANGVITSHEDRNGNTITYTYSGGSLSKVTDPFNRDTTFSYTSGQLTSVSDFASRTATLS